MFTLNLLGPFSAAINDGPFSRFGTIRGQALFIYLALERKYAHGREALMHLVWPDMPLNLAQANLRQTLYLLRKGLHDEGLAAPSFLATRQTVQFDPDFPLTVDAHLFETAAAMDTPVRWQEAADLYRGPFLADFFLPDSEPFEAWAAEKRAYYGRLALDNLDRLAAHYLVHEDYAAAETTSRRALALDDLHERAHRLLLETLVADGKRGEALTHYESFTRKLDEELGIGPDESTQQLVESIRRGELATPHSLFSTPPQNLPARTKPFIGREKELQQLDQFFADPEIRLVTILGPGGMGKTQLAIEWAREHNQPDIEGRARYAHGTHFVDLTPIESLDQVAPAMAEIFAFPLRAEQRSQEQQMLDYLREKELLLVMDNFEHIINAAGFVNDILHAAPGVDVLATSRERLHLSSEQIYAIEGLAFPPAPESDISDTADMESYPAVQLLLRRARHIQPGYQLKPDDRDPAVRICYATAGMPLAIELAASWIDLLPLGRIADDIERCLDVLETDMRDLAPRHRSIRAAFDTSWEHLQTDEKRLFTLLSIFHGDFTWEAVSAVLGREMSAAAPRRALAVLRNKSLLNFDPRAERFTLHELLRQYGSEKLHAFQKGEELALAHERYALHYARLLAEHESGLKGPQFIDSLRLIESDFENTLAAWEWLIENERRANLASVMDSFGLFQEIQGYYPTGRRSFKSLTTRWQKRLAGQSASYAEATRDLLFLAKALAWQSAFEHERQKAESLLQESLALLDDPRLVDGHRNAELAFVCYRLSRTLHQAQPARAVAFVNQALTLYEGCNDLWGVGCCLQSLGYTSQHFNHKKSRQYLIQASEIFEKIDDRRSHARTLLFLIMTVSLLGDDETLEKTLAKYQAVVAGLEQPVFQRETLTAHAAVNTARGNFSEAIIYRKKLISYFKALGRSVSFAKVEMAIALLHDGQFDKGRALLLQAREDLEEKAVENDHRLAFCYQILGMLALAEDAHAEALDFLQQALIIYQNNDNRVNLVSTNALLAIALFGLGDLESARSHLVASLKSNLDRTGFLALQEAFLGVGLLWAHEGNIVRARKLLELVWQQPRFKKSALFNGIAGREIDARTAALPPGELETIIQQAAETDPWEEAAVLLDELCAAGWENND